MNDDQKQLEALRQAVSELLQAEELVQSASALLTQQIVVWLGSEQMARAKWGIKAQEGLKDLREHHGHFREFLAGGLDSSSRANGPAQVARVKRARSSVAPSKSSPTPGGRSKAKVKRKKKHVAYYYDSSAERLSYHCKPRNGGEYTHHVSRTILDQTAEICSSLSGDGRLVFDWDDVERLIGDMKQYQVRLAIRFFVHVGALRKVSLKDAGRRGCYQMTTECHESGTLDEMTSEKLETLELPPQ